MVALYNNSKAIKENHRCKLYFYEHDYVALNLEVQEQTSQTLVEL